MALFDLLTNDGESVYYKPKFRTMLEDHMTYLRNRPDNTMITIETAYAYKFAGDLFGLLQYMKVPDYMHWIIMRMNNITTPTDYRDDMLSFLQPNPNIIEKLRSSFQTQQKMKK